MATPIAHHIYTKNGKIQTGFANVNSYKAKIAINSTCCCAKGHVLLWSINCDTTWGGRLLIVKSIYTDAGYTCHTTSDWTGNIDDYAVIIWTMAQSDPVWWSSIKNGYWTGRILITAEWFTGVYGYPLTYNYVKGIKDVTGIDLALGALSMYAIVATKPHALTVGQPTMQLSATCLTSGGTTLCPIQEDGVTPWLSENTVHSNFGLDISFVISGDSSFIADHYNAHRHNSQFLFNLVDVPVG